MLKKFQGTRGANAMQLIGFRGKGLAKQIATMLRFNGQRDWQELPYGDRVRLQPKIDYNLTPNYDWIIQRMQCQLEQCLVEVVDEKTMNKILDNLKHQRSVNKTMERGRQILEKRRGSKTNERNHLAMEA